MPKKFIRCVKEVKKAEMKRYGREKYNPYAVCRKSTGFYGSTHHIGMLHPKCQKCKHHRCSTCRYKHIKMRQHHKKKSRNTFTWWGLKFR